MIFYMKRVSPFHFIHSCPLPLVLYGLTAAYIISHSPTMKDFITLYIQFVLTNLLKTKKPFISEDLLY